MRRGVKLEQKRKNILSGVGPEGPDNMTNIVEFSMQKQQDLSDQMVFGIENGNVFRVFVVNCPVNIVSLVSNQQVFEFCIRDGKSFF